MKWCGITEWTRQMKKQTLYMRICSTKQWKKSSSYTNRTERNKSTRKKSDSHYENMSIQVNSSLRLHLPLSISEAFSSAVQRFGLVTLPPNWRVRRRRNEDRSGFQCLCLVPLGFLPNQEAHPGFSSCCHFMGCPAWPSKKLDGIFLKESEEGTWSAIENSGYSSGQRSKYGQCWDEMIEDID